jgi:exonuclease III
MVVIQCYAPTEQATSEEKDVFYETLESILRKVKRSEITMVMGDLNAKVGADNKNFEHIMGKHGLGTMNENGERFIELCSNNNLVIGSTLFPHRRIHKVTWESPDHKNAKSNRSYNNP